MSRRITSREKRFSKFHTDIDYLDLKNEQLVIRGKNLVSMVREMDFTDSIYHTLLQKTPTAIEKRLLNASMVSFHTGFQAYPPTILFPRIAISTGASVTQALAAGYASSGELHLGAIENAMKEYLSLERRVGEDVYADTRELSRKKINRHQMLFGFGHPLLKQDPRPAVLREVTLKCGYESKYLTMYDAIRDELYALKHKYPNIDGINGAILLSLGFKPEHGVGLFLLSRTVGMLAHISEELKRPAWSAWSSLIARYIPGMEEKYGT